MKLTVQAKRSGYRRAGIAFSDTTPTVIDTDKFTEEQVDAIRADTNLTVVEGESIAPAAGAKELKAEKAALAEERKQLDADRKELEDARAALQKDRADLEAEIAAFETARSENAAKEKGSKR